MPLATMKTLLVMMRHIDYCITSRLQLPMTFFADFGW